MTTPTKRKRAARPAKRTTRAKVKKTVRPVPPGYHTVTPYLTVRDATRAIVFYKRAFGAQELMRMPGPGGKVMHAELKIGDSVVMLSDEDPGMGDTRSPQALGGTVGYLFVYVPNVDAAVARAVAAGAEVTMPVADMFWGDRFGKLIDPFGHRWGFATHKEDLAPEEIDKRAQAAFGQMGPERT